MLGFNLHTVLSAASYAGAIGAFLRWHVMISAPKTALRASNAMLMLSGVLFVVGTCIALDGAEHQWLRKQPWPFWIMLLSAAVILGWMVDSASRDWTTPLLDAAKEAYSRTSGADIAAFAEAPLGKKSVNDRTITYYCLSLSERLPIFGYWLHESGTKQINTPERRNRHDFRMRDGVLVFQERSGDGYFRDLHVFKKDLPAALDSIRAITPDLLPLEETAEDIIAKRITLARPIMDKLQDHDAMPPTQELSQWNHDTAAVVRKALGLAFEAQFTEPRTFSDADLGPLGRNAVNVLKIGLQHKIGLLYQFIQETRKP